MSDKQWPRCRPYKKKRTRSDGPHHAWTDQDEAILCAAVLQHNFQWGKIAETTLFGNEHLKKTQISAHWQNLKKCKVKLMVTTNLLAGDPRVLQVESTLHCGLGVKKESVESSSSDSEEFPINESTPTQPLNMPVIHHTSGPVDKPHVLYTSSHVYYFWWKSPNKSYSFDVSF